MSHSHSLSPTHTPSQSRTPSRAPSQSRTPSRTPSQSQSQYRDYNRDSTRSGHYTPRSPSYSSPLGSPITRSHNLNLTYNLQTITNNTYTSSPEGDEGEGDTREIIIRSRYDGTPRPASPPPPRTLDDIRDQVSHEVAIHTMNKLRDFDGVKIGVRLVMTSGRDDDYLRLIGAHLQFSMRGKQYLVALASSPFTGGPSLNTLLICSSSEDLVQRCVLLSSSKFLGRVVGASPSDPTCWIATIRDLGSEPHDETALWDVLEKSARAPIDPLLPPPGTRGIHDMVAEARAKLQRISPEQALDELRETQVGAPTFLVDIRSSEQRRREGAVHGSLIIDRNALEWKFDPRASSRLLIADRYDLRIIVFDQVGDMSSLAAHSLQQIGLLNATDIIGGYEAWKNAGLPIDLDTMTTTTRENTTQNLTTRENITQGQDTTQQQYATQAHTTFATEGVESEFLPEEYRRHEHTNDLQVA
ncbi:hypothetical protein BJ165DRAFT_1351640 [Panaeolus papilionaceus]|nr:hypothetical protein BJ165DRAFT_1351640 [Panaeolus papilionaceus]